MALPESELVWLTAAEQQVAMAAGEVTAVELCTLYLQRITDIDRGGPRLNSVLEVSPEALVHAAAADAELQATGPRSALHGICVLLKDNIDTDTMHTTAGSLALVDSKPLGDAPLVTRLKQAGAVILGKANLSEWANFRGNSSSGWSGRGGQCRNPHVLGHTPSGSSAGSGASVAAALSAVAIGSETDGSIVSPANSNGVVGIKPTIGLISRHGIIPISAVQDTAGPMTRCVADAAALLSVLAAPDPNDPATAKQPTNLDTDYAAHLKVDGLHGARIGVLRKSFDGAMHGKRVGVGDTNLELLPEDAAKAALEQAVLEPLRACGAVLVDNLEIWSDGEIEAAGWADRDALMKDYRAIMPYEFRQGVGSYLKTRRVARQPLGSSAFMPTTLEELAEFNIEHADEEMQLFGQESWEAALATELTPDTYDAISAKLQKIAGPDGIDKLLAAHNLDALVCPAAKSSFPAAMCGYPIAAVPAGVVRGQPFAAAFIGTAFSEATLVRLAYAFEQATGAIVRPEFRSQIDAPEGPDAKL